MGFDGNNLAQPSTQLPYDDFALANVNLDLDQDWTWYSR